MAREPLSGTIGVTGATGFLGRHLVRSLVREGYRPILFARRLPDGEPLDGLPWAGVDLLDHDGVREALLRSRPSVLVHLAGVRRPPFESSAAVACTTLNVAATVNLLDAANRAGVGRVVIVGSSEEYGHGAGPSDESTPLQPHTIYGLSKASATRFAQMMHVTEKCPVVIVRPFSVYGPGQPPVMFVAEAVDCAVRGLPFRMTEGHQRRDFVFVEDVVAGLRAALAATDVEGRAFNLGSGEPHALRDVAAQIWRATGSEAPLLVGARKAPPEELHDTWADIAEARRLLGWSPQVPLDEGLRRTIAWAQETVKQGP